MAAGDGSKLPHGELISEADSKPRNHPKVASGFSTSNFGTGPAADDYRRHAEAAAAAARAVNDGAADGSAPAPGLEALLSGDVPAGSSGVTGSGNTWSDPSSRAGR
jgi:hypothetical protein